ncbi:MAG: hypothetical protein JWL77_2497, partial [Chthonomonadaceae bacterium]|nr:hypothetical protein [Chthonomonadaceae bacterium]
MDLETDRIVVAAPGRTALIKTEFEIVELFSQRSKYHG